MFLVLVAVMAASVSARAQSNQDSFTPMPLDSGFGPLRLTQPSIPVEQIVKDFTAQEAVFDEALHHYTYRRAARVDTVNDDTHKVDGEYYQVDDVTFRPGGGRMEKVLFSPPSTLSRIMMSISDFQDIQHNYQFVLTPENIAEYDVKYVGQQKIDQVDCYVFDVTPKQIEKNKRYFKGRVWVDQQAKLIVVTNGWMVPDDTKPGHQDLHPPFITWRQQIDGHYWFPVYSKGEGILHFTGGSGYMAEDVHIREVVKYTDYKRFGSTSKIIFGGQTAPDPNQPTSQPPATPQKKK